jgi:hypothetical protein
MAWAVRQSRENRVASGNPTRAFSSTPLTGSTLVACVALESDAGNCTGVADPNNGAWTAAGPLEILTSGFAGRVFYKENAIASATTVTATCTGSGAHMLILEITGGLTSGVLDTYTVDKEILQAAVSSGAVTLAAAGEFVFGFIISNSNIAAGSGFTQIQNTNFSVVLVSEWKEESTTTGEVTGTVSGGAGYLWMAFLLAFKPLGGGGGGGGGGGSATPVIGNTLRRMGQD